MCTRLDSLRPYWAASDFLDQRSALYRRSFAHLICSPLYLCRHNPIRRDWRCRYNLLNSYLLTVFPKSAPPSLRYPCHPDFPLPQQPRKLCLFTDGFSWQFSLLYHVYTNLILELNGSDFILFIFFGAVSVYNPIKSLTLMSLCLSLSVSLCLSLSVLSSDPK